MAEYTRGIKVVIEVDTNKNTYSETLVPYDHENRQEYAERVKEKLDEILLEKEY